MNILGSSSPIPHSISECQEITKGFPTSIRVHAEMNKAGYSTLQPLNLLFGWNRDFWFRKSYRSATITAISLPIVATRTKRIRFIYKIMRVVCIGRSRIVVHNSKEQYYFTLALLFCFSQFECFHTYRCGSQLRNTFEIVIGQFQNSGLFSHLSIVRFCPFVIILVDSFSRI